MLNIIQAVRQPQSAYKTLLNSRRLICEAFAIGGPGAALTEVAAQSHRLTFLVAVNAITWRAVFRTLLQVSCNLQLVKHFGKDRVRSAIYAGHDFIAEAA